MADAADAGAEVVADLVVVGRRQSATQEGCHLVGLDAVNGRADDLIIERLKLGLTVEQDVGGILGLHDAPVVAGTEPAGGGTERPGPAVRVVEATGKSLGSVDVIDGDERIVFQGMVYPRSYGLVRIPAGTPPQNAAATKRACRLDGHFVMDPLSV